MNTSDTLDQCRDICGDALKDWLSYNLLLSERMFDKLDRQAIAIDPSYISKSGKSTLWIGYF